MYVHECTHIQCRQISNLHEYAQIFLQKTAPRYLYVVHGCTRERSGRMDGVQHTGRDSWRNFKWGGTTATLLLVELTHRYAPLLAEFV